MRNVPIPFEEPQQPPQLSAPPLKSLPQQSKRAAEVSKPQAAIPRQPTIEPMSVTRHRSSLTALSKHFGSYLSIYWYQIYFCDFWVFLNPSHGNLVCRGGEDSRQKQLQSLQGTTAWGSPWSLLCFIVGSVFITYYLIKKLYNELD